MPPPPLIRRRLRPPFRRVFPSLLTAEHGEVQKRPYAAEHLHTATAGVIVAIDRIALTEERAQAECLMSFSRQAEVAVEIAVNGGEPRDGPAHALPVSHDVRERRARHEDERRVACVQMREIDDLIDEERATGTTRVRPPVHARGEHEVVEDQLPPPFKQIEQ